jgi:hypothetical protein
MIIIRLIIIIIIIITYREEQEEGEKRLKILFSSLDYRVGSYTYFMVSRIPSLEITKANSHLK